MSTGHEEWKPGFLCSAASLSTDTYVPSHTPLILEVPLGPSGRPLPFLDQPEGTAAKIPWCLQALLNANVEQALTLGVAGICSRGCF